MDGARGLSTLLVHGGSRRTPFGETSEAIFLTSGFVYERAEVAEARFAEREEGFTYSRLGNPTSQMFEERMALLEGAEAACATASGMAAIFGTLMAHLQVGDRVVASRLLFGSTRIVLDQFLPRFGIAVELVDGTDLAAWERALARPARIVLFETPGNPTLEIIDIAAVAELAHAAGAIVVVDNVVATPVLQKPLALGADIVVYSATKHIDGQGRCLGGVILSSEKVKRDILVPWLRHTGPSLSPFNAWLLLKGLETLALRVEAESRSALALARFLASHPGVAEVLYPGLESHPAHALAMRQMRAGGPILAFRVGGGRRRAFEVLDRLRIVRISNNLGDVRSLATHPASTTHSKMAPAEREALGISEDLLRLSVGLEDLDDLVADLDQALR
ncbi:O-succinylhomoserine sulfhydrylase [bacterium HR40]|nr:O-succinylhomoserine sulfhydrylase [bacterium HR40]